jgi:hypothetical protein
MLGVVQRGGAGAGALPPLTPTMTLLWRSWTAVTIVTATVLAVFVVLATLQFGSIHASLVGERLIVLADRTVAPFASVVRLGLPLTGVRNAEALLERARQTDDDIRALFVFDDAGQIVHAAGTSEVRSTRSIPPDAFRARADAAGRPWFRETSLGFVASVDLPRPDGTSAGGILIVYPLAGTSTQVRAMLAELSLTAIGVLLGATVAAAGLLRWGLRRALRQHDAIESACRAFEADSWRRAAGRVAEAEDGAHTVGGKAGASPAAEATRIAELRAALGAAEARYQDVGRQIAAAGDAAR